LDIGLGPAHRRDMASAFRANGLKEQAMTIHQNSELEAFKARIAEQDKIIAALKAQSDRKITCKVTEKGGVSVYGLGRFPVTLYGSQWDKLAANMKGVMDFVEANRALLSTKD